jgi:hypothetical protein
MTMMKKMKMMTMTTGKNLHHGDEEVDAQEGAVAVVVVELYVVVAAEVIRVAAVVIAAVTVMTRVQRKKHQNTSGMEWICLPLS